MPWTEPPSISRQVPAVLFLLFFFLLLIGSLNELRQESLARREVPGHGCDTLPAWARKAP